MQARRHTISSGSSSFQNVSSSGGLERKVSDSVVRARASQEDESFQADKSYDWFEIFINLFYLAFLIKLGDIMLYCEHSVEIYLFTIAMFLGIYMNKFELDLYLSKYGFNDIVNKVFMLIYSAGIFIMILNVNATLEGGESTGLVEFHQECHEYRGYVIGFTAGWIMTRGSMLIMYIVISYFLRDTNLLISKAPILLSSLVVVTVNLVLRRSDYDDSYSSVRLLLAAALIEYLGFAVWQLFVVGTLLHPLLQHSKATVLVSIHRQSTRTATFAVITLAVSVVELMTPVLHSSSFDHYLALCIGFVIVVCLAVNYFHVIPPKGRRHALSVSKLRGTAWMMMQPVFSYCVFGVGIILKMLFSEDSANTLHKYNVDATLGVFLGLASLLLLTIRLTHRSFKNMTRRQRVASFCRLVISMCHVIVGFLLSDVSLQAALAVHAALCAIYVGIDVAKHHRKNMMYLQILSKKAWEEDEQAQREEEAAEAAGMSENSHPIRNDAYLYESGKNDVVRLTRGLSDRKIQIPSKFASSSQLPVTRGASGLRRMSTADAGGMIQLKNFRSEGKIQLPRKASFSSRSLHPNEEDSIAVSLPKKQRVVVVKRRSKSNQSPSEGAAHIHVSRQFHSSVDVIRNRTSSPIAAVRNKSSGSIVKNQDGKYVLERVVETKDGERKIQHAVLHKVLRRKSKTDEKDREQDNGGGGHGDHARKKIIVRKIKSSSNALHRHEEVSEDVASALEEQQEDQEEEKVNIDRRNSNPSVVFMEDEENDATGSSDLEGQPIVRKISLNRSSIAMGRAGSITLTGSPSVNQNKKAT